MTAKMMKKSEHLPYKERLKYLGVFYLKKREREVQREVTEIYITMHSVENVTRGKLFSFKNIGLKNA